MRKWRPRREGFKVVGQWEVEPRLKLTSCVAHSSVKCTFALPQMAAVSCITWHWAVCKRPSVLHFFFHLSAKDNEGWRLLPLPYPHSSSQWLLIKLELTFICARSYPRAPLPLYRCPSVAALSIVRKLLAECDDGWHLSLCRDLAFHLHLG